MPVRYASKALGPRPYGRRYPALPGCLANLGNKQLRTLLVGATHWEIDVEGCHYALFANLVEKHLPQALPEHMRTVAAARAFLVSAVGPTLRPGVQPGYEKTLLTTALNTSITSFLRQAGEICRAGLYDLRLKEFATILAAAKKELLPHLLPLLPEDARIQPKNQVYFCMEYFEARFMGVLVSTMLGAQGAVWTPRSLIWLHDGILVWPPPPREIFETGLREALRDGGWHLNVRMRPLAAERELILQSLVRTAHVEPQLASSSKPPASNKRPWVGATLRAWVAKKPKTLLAQAPPPPPCSSPSRTKRKVSNLQDQQSKLEQFFSHKRSRLA